MRRPRLAKGARPVWAAVVILVTDTVGVSGQAPLVLPGGGSAFREVAPATTHPELGGPAGGMTAWPTHPPYGLGPRGPLPDGAAPSPAPDWKAAPQSTAPAISPVRAFLYSGMLPGLGQRRLEQRRWVGFIALELIGWGFLWERQRTGRDFRTRYRDLAWFVARRGTSVERMDGDFEYYEALGQYRASGSHDSDPFMGGVQPEPDTTTFNGSLWSLANEIFLVPGEQGVPGPGSPEYDQAIEYYINRSIGLDFYWDWNGDDVNRAEYDRLIRRSDAALRQMTTVVGVIIANHLASAFDAFITARLRAADSKAEVRLLAAPEGRGRWWLGGQLVP